MFDRSNDVKFFIHEIRNKMIPILNYAEMIQSRYHRDEKLKKMSSIMSECSREILDLIEKMNESSSISDEKARKE